MQQSPAAPPLTRPVVFDQLWCDLAFLHWPVDPDQVARWLPPGARPDVVDGVTHVGLVPFRMRRAGLLRGHPVPWLGHFGEVNVRLYSTDDHGRHGVVFRSLDCNRLGVVAAARAINVPYVYARIRSAHYPPTPTYDPVDLPADSHRWWTVRRPGGTRSEIRLTVGAPVEPTPLELHLTARWGMHSALAGRGLFTPNRHGAWPLREATLDHLDDGLVASAGIVPVGPMLRPLWSPGVRAQFGLPHRVERPQSLP